VSGVALDARVRVDRGAYALDVALQAAPGEIVAVMGPSGAGKSTLFDTIAGFVRLSGGHVRLDGRTVDAASGPHVAPQHRGVVLLGQEPRLFPHLSAVENIAFGPRARGVPRAQARADAGVWLQRVGLAGMGSRRPALLSGGQQQRVALARALATAPRLLLLDEPLTSLDPETAADIRMLLGEGLRRTATTALIATHDAADAAGIAERLAVLESGRITQEGRVHDVLAAPATPFVAAVVATMPGRTSSGWTARIADVRPAAVGLVVRAHTASGDEVVLQLPPESAAVPGATVTVTPGP
jgi:molybdate transport system ATP-binding protein